MHNSCSSAADDRIRIWDLLLVRVLTGVLVRCCEYSYEQIAPYNTDTYDTRHRRTLDERFKSPPPCESIADLQIML